VMISFFLIQDRFYKVENKSLFRKKLKLSENPNLRNIR
jgi:hypothetical protein